MAPLKCQQNLVMLAIVMVLALGGILQSQGEESEEPWVGNNHIGLQQLSPTNYPKKDGTFNVKMEIRSHAPDGHVRFKFSNSNVSSWKGHAMNAGNELNSDPDLTLTVDQQTPQAGITWSAPPAEPGVQLIGAGWDGDAPDPFTVKVKVHDYGAYGTLTAQLYYDGGEPEEPVSLDLPRDDNGNKIADGWQNDGSENYDASADDETGSGGNLNNGDNFSVFTEYRGFELVTGYSGSGLTTDHKRLSPSQKEVLIFVAGGSITSHGIGYASHLENDTGEKIVAYQVTKHSGYPHYWVNYKGTDVPGHRDQRVVRVLENTVDLLERLGYTHPYPNVYFSVYYPNRVDYIYIYTLEIDNTYTSQSDRNKVRQSVMGHEIGHAINLDHCDGVHSSCIMRIDPPPTTRGDRYDSDHDVNLSGYKMR